MSTKFTKTPIFVYIILVSVSAVSALVFFHLGGSLAEFAGKSKHGFSFSAGGAIAGFLIVFWVSGLVIERLYGIKSLSSEELEGLKDLQLFRERIIGYWWQKLTPDEPCALSFIIISPKTTANSLKLNGWAYDREGILVTKWKTEAGFIDLNEKIIFYAWKRKTSSLKYEPYEGFGQISFLETEDQSRAEGFFLDINYTDMTSTKKFSTEYWRPEKHEQQIMQGDNSDLISGLIQKKLSDVG